MVQLIYLPALTTAHILEFYTAHGLQSPFLHYTYSVIATDIIDSLEQSNSSPRWLDIRESNECRN